MEEDDPIFEGMEYEQSDTRFEVVSICNQALNAVEGINVMSKEDSFRVLEIKRKSLKLIEHHINMLYDEYFED